MITLKNKAHRKYIKSKSDADKKYYIELKNYVRDAINREKTAYMQYELRKNKNNQKALWNKIHNFGINTKSKPCSINLDVSSNTLNDYFINIAGASSVDNTLVNYYTNNKLNDSFNFVLKEICASDIYNVTKTIKSQAMGIDNITIKMINLVLPYCIELLVNIINTSFKTGIFPDIWKTAVVIPYPKVSNASEVTDLRPLSILPTLSKIIEKLVAEQLKTFLECYSILPPLQSGFRRKHSTQTALLKVVNDISKALDDSHATILILLDQSKAFDVVDFNLLLSKLSFIGVNHAACSWFKSYINFRGQAVKFNNVISNIKLTKTGVPQGSILGPILFSIFTFDLPSSINYCRYHLYADDLQLYISFKLQELDEAINNINQDLLSFANWCSRNGLKINPQKTVAMFISNRIKVNLTVHNLLINGSTIRWVTSAKNLGLIFDNNLSFEKHVDKLFRISFMKLKMLHRFKYSLNEEVKLKLVKSLIYPNLDYCSAVFFNFLTSNYKYKIQRVQNACLRFVCCIPFRAHVTPFRLRLEEFNTRERAQYLFCIFLWKLLHHQCPGYLNIELIKRSMVHQIDVRYNHYYSIPSHSTTKFRGSFSYTAPKTLNLIIKFLPLSESVFKNKIRKFIQDVNIN